MLIFNEETKNKGKIVLLLSKEEARTLIDALLAATEKNKLKRTWKNLKNKLIEKAGVY